MKEEKKFCHKFIQKWFKLDVKMKNSSKVNEEIKRLLAAPVEEVKKVSDEEIITLDDSSDDDEIEIIETLTVSKQMKNMQKSKPREVQVEPILENVTEKKMHFFPSNENKGSLPVPPTNISLTKSVKADEDDIQVITNLDDKIQHPKVQTSSCSIPSFPSHIGKTLTTSTPTSNSLVITPMVTSNNSLITSPQTSNGLLTTATSNVDKLLTTVSTVTTPALQDLSSEDISNILESPQSTTPSGNTFSEDITSILEKAPTSLLTSPTEENCLAEPIFNGNSASPKIIDSGLGNNANIVCDQNGNNRQTEIVRPTVINVNGNLSNGTTQNNRPQTLVSATVAEVNSNKPEVIQPMDVNDNAKREKQDFVISEDADSMLQHVKPNHTQCLECLLDLKTIPELSSHMLSTGHINISWAAQSNMISQFQQRYSINKKRFFFVKMEFDDHYDKKLSLSPLV